MLPIHNILADSDDGIGKVIFGVIVFIIWGISALVNMTKKTGTVSPQAQADMERAMREQMEEARRRQAAAMALQQMGGPPMPPPMVMPPRGPAVPPMRSVAQIPMPPRVPQQQQRRPALRQNTPAAQIQRPQQKQKKPKQPQRRAPAIAIPTALLQSLPTDTPGVRESEIGQGVAPASPARRQATSMAGNAVMRLTPANLRQQFILTELLQPPLALRDSR